MLLEFLRALESGEKSADHLLLHCLRRIAQSECEIRAWVEVQAQPALAAGPLNGIPFGAKDIFETAALATEFGSSLYEGRKGEADAHVITDLRRAGAILLGKTRTTAFASFDPTTTRNPRALDRTPGGSSSGSAAAVAAGMVPFALGTQTLGSVLRPASFCGICGFKPTFGLLSTESVMPFAPSLDTVGLFTETAADMAALWSRGFGGRPEGTFTRAAQFRVAAEEPMLRAMDDYVARLRAKGMHIDTMAPPEGWTELQDAARTVNEYEGARTQRDRFQRYGDRIGTRLAELVQRGLAMPREKYDAARAHIAHRKRQMSALFREYPVVLTPAAQGPAPLGLASTGNPMLNAPWTALGAPAITVPIPQDGPPLGVQLTAECGRDDALVAIAVYF